jgi:hypothetical protein
VPVAIAVARARAISKGLRNVTFREGDPSEMKFDQPFDAIVGRLILMHCADATAMLRKLSGHLRRGGLMAYIEPAWSYARSLPPVPLYERCCRWIVETSRSAGVDTEMGLKLYATFVAAGLPAPTMLLWAGTAVSQQVPTCYGPSRTSSTLCKLKSHVRISLRRSSPMVRRWRIAWTRKPQRLTV